MDSNYISNQLDYYDNGSDMNSDSCVNDEMPLSLDEVNIFYQNYECIARNYLSFGIELIFRTHHFNNFI